MTDHQPDDDLLSAARRAHGPISEDEIKQGEEMLARATSQSGSWKSADDPPIPRRRNNLPGLP